MVIAGNERRFGYDSVSNPRIADELGPVKASCRLANSTHVPFDFPLQA